MEKPSFILGLRLNRLFYEEVVGPLIKREFPHLSYSAGLVGHGSDVLGLDTVRSTDHDWGPRLHIFFKEKDFDRYKDKVDKMLRQKLPLTFRGFSTNFSKEQPGYLKHIPAYKTRGEVNHLFSFWTAKSFFQHYLDFNPYEKPSFRDWLTFPQQALLEITSGEIYYDGIGIERVRKKFSYYPDRVWIYIYFRQWGKIGDREAFMFRTGEVGDELGSNIIATQIVEDLIELCFLIEKKYIPYPKWFGSMFSRLESFKSLKPLFLKTVHLDSWQQREKYLVKAYEIIAKKHNELKVTKPIQTRIKNFSVRPFSLPHGYAVYTKIYEQYIKKRKATAPIMRLKYHLGAIDQFVDFVQLNRLKYVYRQFRHLIR